LIFFIYYFFYLETGKISKYLDTLHGNRAAAEVMASVINQFVYRLLKINPIL
jgi:hypothetical protein